MVKNEFLSYEGYCRMFAAFVRRQLKGMTDTVNVIRYITVRSEARLKT